MMVGAPAAILHCEELLGLEIIQSKVTKEGA